MKIFNTHFFPSDMLNKVGNYHAMLLFTGEVPADVESIPFDTTDMNVMVSEAASLMHIGYSAAGNGTVVANNVKMLRSYPGHSLNANTNEYLVTPRKVELFGTQTKIDDMQDTVSLLSSEFTSFTLGRRESLGVYLEAEFDSVVTIDRIELAHNTNSSYSIDDYQIEYFSDGVWTIGEEIRVTRNSAGSGQAELNLVQAYTCSKIRVLYSEITGSTTYMGGLSFFSDTGPTEELVEALPYTWFLSVDLDVKFGDGEVPLLIGDAGGPNSNKEVALNVYNAVPGEEVKLLNFKFKSVPMEAI